MPADCSKGQGLSWLHPKELSKHAGPQQSPFSSHCLRIIHPLPFFKEGGGELKNSPGWDFELHID
jgi:hypothetical protein